MRTDTLRDCRHRLTHARRLARPRLLQWTTRAPLAVGSAVEWWFEPTARSAGEPDSSSVCPMQAADTPPGVRHGSKRPNALASWYSKSASTARCDPCPRSGFGCGSSLVGRTRPRLVDTRADDCNSRRARHQLEANRPAAPGTPAVRPALALAPALASVSRDGSGVPATGRLGNRLQCGTEGGREHGSAARGRGLPSCARRDRLEQRGLGESAAATGSGAIPHDSPLAQAPWSSAADPPQRASR
jgi:hypothetical protein